MSRELLGLLPALTAAGRLLLLQESGALAEATERLARQLGSCVSCASADGNGESDATC